MKMATGELQPTWGEIELNGFSIYNPLSIVFLRANVGICFQENSLFPFLTVREHLHLIMGLKFNADADASEGYINDLMKKLELERDADKLTVALSGGNKRKEPPPTPYYIPFSSLVLFFDLPFISPILYTNTLFLTVKNLNLPSVIAVCCNGDS